jgi:hypothetical protein
MPSPFYITTAIDYANGSPHLGHAYEKVLSDVISRHMRMSGRQVHFLTGLDEHGQKVQQTALKRGVEPQVLVDEIAAVFKGMLGDLNIAEPRALIGFAGPRVIQQTVRETLPEGFQRSEFLLEHGALDMIVDRRDLRSRIAAVLALLMHQPRAETPPESG